MLEKQQLNFDEYDKDLVEIEQVSKDEETNVVTYPQVEFLYSEA